jgi:uncharacterized damage-inducible protein DinB
MIGVAYVQRMARYNRWQNENLYGAASRLTDEERRRERGAFFGSIQKTLSHLLWGDQLWMNRFGAADRPPVGIPQSPSLHADWPSLKSRREAFDAEIVKWADGLDADWLTGDLRYFSQSSARDVSGPKWVFVTHFFNHQTHHRGQVHGMLTQTGAKLQDTDLVVMPN